jgi:rhodanese-related sulfurtransferase
VSAADEKEAGEGGELELAPERVKALLEAGEATLVDVREDREWEVGRVAGAVHIELNELTPRADEIPKEKTVVFYCRSGNRSAMAAEAFAQGGWDAHNMAGGLVAWQEAGFPLQPEGAEVLDRKGRPPG